MKSCKLSSAFLLLLWSKSDPPCYFNVGSCGLIIYVSRAAYLLAASTQLKKKKAAVIFYTADNVNLQWAISQ